MIRIPQPTASSIANRQLWGQNAPPSRRILSNPLPQNFKLNSAKYFAGIPRPPNLARVSMRPCTYFCYLLALGWSLDDRPNVKQEHPSGGDSNRFSRSLPGQVSGRASRSSLSDSVHADPLPRQAPHTHRINRRGTGPARFSVASPSSLDDFPKGTMAPPGEEADAAVGAVSGLGKTTVQSTLALDKAKEQGKTQPTLNTSHPLPRLSVNSLLFLSGCPFLAINGDDGRFLSSGHPADALLYLQVQISQDGVHQSLIRAVPLTVNNRRHLIQCS